ncbi:MAG TPA: YebC/PmpR family DNA-binding transcriptional regulator [Burkholderiaceae bacterium]|nr:YebC/PmpR family DNA-binding transcriptional regulator [Burkholderiaceae bacterium]
MAGHSKWANIQYRKGRQDAKRGQIWTKVIREITVAARGGADPAFNPRLRLALEKASAANVPKETVNKAIARGSGKLEGAHYEEVRYEGYGVGGAAVIVDAMTDNRTRTVAEVRHAFSKHGGNLGIDGSVAYQFRHCGHFVFAPGASEEKVLEAALDAGAQDVISDADGSIEVICEPADFEAVRRSLEAAGLKPAVADVTMQALNEIPLHGGEAEQMRQLLDALEDLDDTQHVYTSALLDA